MGRAKRTIPRRLPEKLMAIRTGKNWTLEETAGKLENKLSELDYPDISLYSGNIYEFEKGTREPLLPVLLAYALVGETTLDQLVDDRRDLENHYQ